MQSYLMIALQKMIMNAMTTMMIEMMMMMMANPAASIPTLATIMAEPGEWKRSTTNPVIVIMMTMMITIMMTIILVMMIIRGTIHVILALASSLRGLTGTNMI